MSKKLETICDAIETNPDLLYYRWQGIIFSEGDVLSRLDKTYLYILRSDLQIQRIIGYPSFNKYGETIIEYPSTTTYKIKTGKRKGRIVPPKKIGASERFEQATLYKKLQIGDTPDVLNSTARGDSHIINILDDFDINTIPVNEQLVHPSFYLCTKSEDPILHLRQSGEAFTYINSFPEYDLSLPIDDNLKNLHFYMFIDAGEGRKGYPFEYLFGKGVLAADLAVSGAWRAVPRGNAEIIKEFLKIDLKA